jgi:hypothetical protein
MIRTALLATLALLGADAIERRILGRRPAYDVDEMGRRLLGSAGAGRALRWIYGPALAVAQQKLRLPPLLFGPAIALGELFAMPRSGATPPVREWRRGDVGLLFAHATAFSLIVHLVQPRACGSRHRTARGCTPSIKARATRSSGSRA